MEVSMCKKKKIFFRIVNEVQVSAGRYALTDSFFLEGGDACKLKLVNLG